MRSRPIQCDIRGCAAVGEWRVFTDDGEAMDLCDRHVTPINRRLSQSIPSDAANGAVDDPLGPESIT